MGIVHKRFAPFAIAFATVIVVSVLAYTHHLPAFVGARGVDKVLHFTMSTMLAGCLGRAIKREVLAAFVVFAVLAIDEYFQRYSAVRTSDWYDLLADFGGVSFGALLTSVLSRDPARSAAAPRPGIAR